MKQLIADMEALNNVAPYHVEHLGYNFYRFQSKLGASYQIRFRDGIYLGDNDCYHLSLIMDTNGLNMLSFLDGDVGRTVIAVLKQFFVDNPKDCLIFSSEASKGRYELKSRFYHHWFKWYQQYDGRVELGFFHSSFMSKEVEFPLNIVLRTDHPQFEQIRDTFLENTQVIADTMYEE